MPTKRVAPASGPALDQPLPPVAELLPHEPPMILIDELVEWSPTRSLVRAEVRASGPFTLTGELPGEVGGQVPATVLLEYMAQAIAAAEGMRGRGEARAPGLLLGTRELELDTPAIAVGDTLEIRVEHSFSDPDSGLACYDCEVHGSGQRLAAARVNVMLAPELPQRVKGGLNS
ncbi:ApeP family dehydratase [Enhygromyxa salina]|uniref:(3R)-hydroxymyristoyl-ACP dehydratase n=1 Tax=Enhygromyxa salina TaxID=215803 RepID=A0A2S9YRF2_9BACT|nr:hypothetical protein [Enhygromyxa salina]PRQ07658.1 (3R)-hydroxymyristoyl-ACP dehydratase [Enhygromyxa salina]